MGGSATGIEPHGVGAFGTSHHRVFCVPRKSFTLLSMSLPSRGYAARSVPPSTSLVMRIVTLSSPPSSRTRPSSSATRPSPRKSWRPGGEAYYAIALSVSNQKSAPRLTNVADDIRCHAYARVSMFPPQERNMSTQAWTWHPACKEWLPCHLCEVHWLPAWTRIFSPLLKSRRSLNGWGLRIPLELAGRVVGCHRRSRQPVQYLGWRGPALGFLRDPSVVEWRSRRCK
jgi:hypothetical protein